MCHASATAIRVTKNHYKLKTCLPTLFDLLFEFSLQATGDDEQFTAGAAGHEETLRSP